MSRRVPPAARRELIKLSLRVNVWKGALTATVDAGIDS